ncbi:MAG: hypothetical protein II401_11120 [Bacteroidales bacterium]|nr:hypothetical protein [Bacteroidales bacterium]
MNKLRIVIVALAGLILYALLAFIFGYTVAERNFAERHKHDRDTCWLTPDTVKLPPEVTDIHVIDSVPFPVPIPVPGETETVHDTVVAMIPITQSRFVWADTAEIVASGFNVTIDEAVFFMRHEIQYIDNTPPAKALALTLETGVSAILADRRFAPAVYAEGGVLLWRRCKVSAGFGVAYNESAAHGFMYGKIAYVIK